MPVLTLKPLNVMDLRDLLERVDRLRPLLLGDGTSRLFEG
jgi:hypothetical protein